MASSVACPDFKVTVLGEERTDTTLHELRAGRVAVLGKDHAAPAAPPPAPAAS